MNKDITNINNKGFFHGFQELYFNNDKPSYRGVVKNHNRIGYNEYHFSKHTTYYII